MSALHRLVCIPFTDTHATIKHNTRADRIVLIRLLIHFIILLLLLLAGYHDFKRFKYLDKKIAYSLGK